MNNAVLVTTADGKTILAHPTGQLFRQFRPTTSTVASNNIRLRLPTSLASHGMTNAPVTLQLQQQQPHQQVRPMQQVCFVQQPGQRPMFRMPTSTSSTSTVVLDASQLSGLIADGQMGGRQIVVKRISPSPSPPAMSIATTIVTTSTGATRLIQIGGPNNRFIRPPVTTQQMVFRQSRVRPRMPNTPLPTTLALPTVPVSVTASPIVMRMSTQQQPLVWPSQPLTTNQLQGLFQRPRPPPPITIAQRMSSATSSPIVRTILFPRGQQVVTVQQQHQLVNTPLPNFQLPSEPVSPQELRQATSPASSSLISVIKEEPQDPPQEAEGGRVLIQVAAANGTTASPVSRLVLIQGPNGQLLALPASQFSQSGIKIPPRASSAPPTEPLNRAKYPTRPASVDAVGIMRVAGGSQSLRASPALYYKSSTPSPAPSSVASPLMSVATPPMPTLEPNESLSLRACGKGSEGLQGLLGPISLAACGLGAVSGLCCSWLGPLEERRGS
jgi:hypothetical protein